MPGFEEEAFMRAQQMHRRGSTERRPENHSGQNQSQPNSQTEAPKPAESTDNNPKPPQKSANTNNLFGRPAAFEEFFRDRDKSLIILLIVLLMDEKSEPSLLLALIYLLL